MSIDSRIFCTSKHDYTRSPTPWITKRETAVELFHYLTGGGMRDIGRTVEQEERRMRQRRFLYVSAAIAVVWLALLVV